MHLAVFVLGMGFEPMISRMRISRPGPARRTERVPFLLLRLNEITGAKIVHNFQNAKNRAIFFVARINIYEYMFIYNLFIIFVKVTTKRLL